MPIHPLLTTIGRRIENEGGRAFLAGGAVRDYVLGRSTQDWDIEVYGLSAQKLAALLQTFGRVSAVGVSFGVLKLRTAEGVLDFTLARRDNTNGRGQRGYLGLATTEMDLPTAAARRDFTCNAMLQDLVSGAILDFYNGRDDLAAGILRHTSAAFAEDPLRVLRGMQFAARYNLTVAPETAALCRTLQPAFATLAIERIWGEWWKWCTRGIMPSAGLRFLTACGWRACFPALEALAGCPQDPRWHPEGDGFEHTCHCVDAAAKIARREGLNSIDRAVLLLAALCHDLGKPYCTIFKDGRWRSPGHSHHTAPMLNFMQAIGAPPAVVERTVPLVTEHVVHHNPITSAAVRRLAQRLGKASIKELVWLIEADYAGRPPLAPHCPPAVHELLLRATTQAVTRSRPKAILAGRHLLEMGLQPGPAMGKILKAAYEAQLDGKFADMSGARAWAATHLTDADCQSQ